MVRLGMRPRPPWDRGHPARFAGRVETLAPGAGDWLPGKALHPASEPRRMPAVPGRTKTQIGPPWDRGHLARFAACRKLLAPAANVFPRREAPDPASQAGRMPAVPGRTKHLWSTQCPISAADTDRRIRNTRGIKQAATI